MKDSAAWKQLGARYRDPRPRKLLALDGGGIRGALSLSILKSIENVVGRPLHEYFDYIAGTSTGAIIAAGLARGMSVDQLTEFYRTEGPEMFQRTRFLQRFNSLYRNGPLEAKLKQVFGETTTLHPEHLKTLLLVVTRNVTTDSPWPISSNPEARYNAAGASCNLDFPMWKLVRASTAAPVFFPPEIIQYDATDPSKAFVFVDGGVTPYNNPAFLLFRFATHPAYHLEWPTGEGRMLLVSVGTGAAPTLGADAEDPETNLLAAGLGVPGALMYSVAVDQDINCRTFGRCVHGDVIDRELLDLIDREGGDHGSRAERLARPRRPLEQDLGRAFRYARYNADLSAEGLRGVGLSDEDAGALRRMDNATPENIARLLAVGEAAGRQVEAEHFRGFL